MLLCLNPHSLPFWVPCNAFVLRIGGGGGGGGGGVFLKKCISLVPFANNRSYSFCLRHSICSNEKESILEQSKGKKEN